MNLQANLNKTAIDVDSLSDWYLSPYVEDQDDDAEIYCHDLTDENDCLVIVKFRGLRDHSPDEQPWHDITRYYISGRSPICAFVNPQIWPTLSDAEKRTLQLKNS